MKIRFLKGIKNYIYIFKKKKKNSDKIEMPGNVFLKNKKKKLNAKKK